MFTVSDVSDSDVVTSKENKEEEEVLSEDVN
jgi:hypothetical protein